MDDADYTPNRVSFWTHCTRGVHLIDRRPIPTGIRIAPDLNPNRMPFFRALGDAYCADKVTMLISLGASSNVPVTGAIRKHVSRSEFARSPGFDDHIERLHAFYGKLLLGELERSHAIAYSWFCMLRRDDRISCHEFNASVNFEIDLLLQSITYLNERYRLPPRLLSRLFGPRPPTSFFV
jgi:hypothetical protein